MYATLNLPGSVHFCWYGPDTKKKCQKWLDDRVGEIRRLYPATWYQIISPARLISNREAAKWKWRDGRKVFPTEDWTQRYRVPHECV